MKAGRYSPTWRGGVAALGMLAGCSPSAEIAVPPTASHEVCSPIVDDGAPVDFFSDIQPLLGDHCVRCHGGVRAFGSPALNLQSRESAAPVLGAAGDVCSSALFRRIASADAGLRMPAGAPALPTEKIQLVANWISRGATWPRHWAFAPLSQIEPNAIAVRREAWIKSPIDRFILERMEREGIAPSPEADRITLLRRVSLDLTGLPPTTSEVDQFVADTTENAFEKVIDRLLTSPAFGETWGRHWLDQARYGDTDGYERDAARPNAWRWRDWVIDAVNRDQPFDQFTIEQIAGDLLPEATPLQRLATGFHRQTLFNAEAGVDPEEDRTKRVIDRVATLGATWLGLTLGCAQCHGHPYDPISHEEFYRLYGFFNNANEASSKVPGIGASPEGEADVMVENTYRPTYRFIRGDFLNPDDSQTLQSGTPGILHPFTPRGKTPDRFDLARWIVDRSNPLMPRVTVNTIWAHLFGRGIVATLDDFGSRARLPSHPELLDWMGRDFIEHGWRRKRVIKQIVMSATYRQSAAPRADVAEKDPDNIFLARQNRLRLPAETVTDNFLAASGLLAHRRVGGPSVFPPIQPELLNINVFGTAWPTSDGEDRHRRAMYTFHKRTVPYPNLQVFDQPSGYVSVAGRGRSNTPLQALATMHGLVFVDAARALARRVQTEAANRRDQLVLAFRLTVARRPNDAEILELEKLNQDLVDSYELDPKAAGDVVGAYAPTAAPAHVAAAWVATAQVILNLDETITRE